MKQPAPFVARRLTPADAHAYAHLRREALLAEPWAFLRSTDNDPSSDPETVATRLKNPESVIFAVVSGTGEPGATVLAAAAVVRSGFAKTRHRAEIGGVYVTPSFRGQGLGRVIVHGCIEVARAWPGVDLVTLSVSERTPRAQRLYESLGFVAWGTEPDYVRIGDERAAEIHMHLRLH